LWEVLESTINIFGQIAGIINSIKKIHFYFTLTEIMRKHYKVCIFFTHLSDKILESFKYIEMWSAGFGGIGIHKMAQKMQGVSHQRDSTCDGAAK